MRTELSASRSTVYFNAVLFILVGVVTPFLDPVFLPIAAYALYLGLLSLSFKRVDLDSQGFVLPHRGTEELIPFSEVKSVSGGLLGSRHITLTVRMGSSVRRIRFLPEPSHGGIFGGHGKLLRLLKELTS